MIHNLTSGVSETKNIMEREGYGPFDMFRCAWQHRKLIVRLAKREVEARYRGSVLGLLWAFLVPLLMLAVYTFVFSVVFNLRWEMPIAGKGAFALILFSGLIIYTLVAESLNRAPSLMLENVSYIKKVVFPVEVMPWVVVVVALFNAGVSLGILFVFSLVVFGLPSLTILLLPVVMLPVVLLTLGLVWFLASIGVFLRDTRQFMGVLTTMMMFLSPIFYPLTAVPESYRSYIYLNPLTSVLQSSKAVLFWGQMPSWGEWAIYFIVGWLVSWMGYVWFMKTRKGFADVM